MDKSVDDSKTEEENIPLIKMSTNKGQVKYGRTISSIGDPQVRFIFK